ASSWRVWRVSSAQIAATSARTRPARGGKSPRLPIGVATTCSTPAAAVPAGLAGIAPPRSDGRIWALSTLGPVDAADLEMDVGRGHAGPAGRLRLGAGRLDRAGGTGRGAGRSALALRPGARRAWRCRRLPEIGRAHV